ncbi:MAG: prolipoprotein diacylglyceryl transferase [Gammaproteobacteria bacterium]|nr:prolipoprotein diacylglyceryl transferase [Pseudomonadota bacterium]MCH9664188.1 prolipoprotein diacylglyceryl transferase [Gammaproteobacteria bacterium]
MFIYPEIDPVALSLGSFKIHWYGVMYMLAFTFLYFAGAWRCRHNNNQPFHPDLMGDYLFYLILGVIIGGRLGHVIFYNPAFYLENPLDIILIYKGGMSFHGGFLGVMVAMVLFARRVGASKAGVFDIISTDVPIGLMLGRIGNFINGELWGRVTDVPWAMVFPHVDQLPRHPSMLYEALLEGPILWGVILLYRRFARYRHGGSTLVFIIGYSLVRFVVEYVREPETHLGVHNVLGITLTIGQILSLGMIGVGLALIYFLRMQPALMLSSEQTPALTPRTTPPPPRQKKRTHKRRKH